MSDTLVVYCTFPDSNAAAEVARSLVGEHLAACVNLLPEVRSVYRWQDEVCDDPEVLAVIKTAADRFGDLRTRIVELHPYDCPEVIALPVEDGFADYLEWVQSETRP